MSNPIKIEQTKIVLIEQPAKEIRKVQTFAGGKAKGITLPKRFLEQVGREFEEVEVRVMQMQGKFVLLVIPILEKQKEEKEEEK